MKEKRRVPFSVVGLITNVLEEWKGRGRSHRGRYKRVAVCHCTQGGRGRSHRGRYRREGQES